MLSSDLLEFIEDNCIYSLKNDDNNYILCDRIPFTREEVSIHGKFKLNINGSIITLNSTKDDMKIESDLGSKDVLNEWMKNIVNMLSPYGNPMKGTNISKSPSCDKHIVWYSDSNSIWSLEYSLDELLSHDHIDYLSDSPLLADATIHSIHRETGVLFNDKHIFEDCSIVKVFDSRDRNDRYGYYKYDKNEMRYKFHDIHGKQCLTTDNLTILDIVGSLQSGWM